MTVSRNDLKTVQNGDGTKTSFPFSFQISKLDDVKVYITGVNGNQIGPLTNNYRVVLTNSDDLTKGGMVTYPYPTTGTKLQTGEKITIIRESSDLQNSGFKNVGAMFPETFEAALDKLTMHVQELKEKLNRTFKGSIIGEGADYTLPAPAPGKALGWDPEGKRFMNYPNPGKQH
jgi:hypothetical protein